MVKLSSVSDNTCEQDLVFFKTTLVGVKSPKLVGMKTFHFCFSFYPGSITFF